jgi:2,4-dienoyl-CoA reductase-like NADH-dependent reductase (Old Yellow Enzyme family)
MSATPEDKSQRISMQVRSLRAMCSLKVRRIMCSLLSHGRTNNSGNIMGMTFEKPHAATDSEIATIINQFAHAAEFLEKAGYDDIELHGAHGYLLVQFLSSTTNRRTDKYGGSLENRIRLIVEIADECRKRVQSPLFLVLKSTAWSSKIKASRQKRQRAYVRHRKRHILTTWS